MRNLLLFILLTFSALQSANCQIFQEDYKSRNDTTPAEGNLMLDFQGSTYFYNNEYFNPYYKGYTLMGAYLQPQIVYQSNPKLKISAGAHLQRSYGDKLKTKASPLFSVEFMPTKSFSVRMGSFNGGENHGMNEVLYSFENHLTDIVENGILINYNNARISSETWLNWESFITPGDTIQEQFTAGSVNRVSLYKSLDWTVSMPVNFLAHHAGGQINNSVKPVETLINISEGFKISRALSSDFMNKVYAEFNLFHSLGDFVPSSGFGFSAKTGVHLNGFELNAEYFKADDFISFAGNPLFRTYQRSGDPINPYQYGGDTDMLNFKAGYRKKIGKNSYLFLRFEGYHFAGSDKLDYSYSLNFQIRDFLKL